MAYDRDMVYGCWFKPRPAQETRYNLWTTECIFSLRFIHVRGLPVTKYVHVPNLNLPTYTECVTD